MSSSDDSEEDLPIATLRKRYQSSDNESEEEAEFDDDDDFNDDGHDDFEEEEEEELEEDSDEDFQDTDDDVPLKNLKTKKSPPKTSKTSPKKSKSPTKKKATTAKKKTKAKAKKKKTIDISKSTSTLVTASSELYSKSLKGKLIQALLCRWWYAYTWPDPSSLPEETPKNFDKLDGFPGVYVCTSGDDVGKIKDFRDSTKCPNFKNFATKSSEELRELLLIALRTQREALIKAEGSGTSTEKDLNTLEKWATKLNVDKAEKDAMKVLKVAKLSI